jgi:hypothetical protein
MFWGIAAGLGVSVALFAAIRLAAKPAPHTMNKEWQEASNQILIVSRFSYRSILAHMLTSL